MNLILVEIDGSAQLLKQPIEERRRNWRNLVGKWIAYVIQTDLTIISFSLEKAEISRCIWFCGASADGS